MLTFSSFPERRSEGPFLGPLTDALVHRAIRLFVIEKVKAVKRQKTRKRLIYCNNLLGGEAGVPPSEGV